MIKKPKLDQEKKQVMTSRKKMFKTVSKLMT